MGGRRPPPEIFPGALSASDVAEFQGRGLVHFHAIIRLDSPQDRALSPDLEITADELCTVIRQAGARSRAIGEAGGGEVVELRFGEQLDTRVLHGDQDDPEQVAAYVARYACKGSQRDYAGRRQPRAAPRARGAQAAGADGRRRDPPVRVSGP
jgi:hypothetical protein